MGTGPAQHPHVEGGVVGNQRGAVGKFHDACVYLGPVGRIGHVGGGDAVHGDVVPGKVGHRLRRADQCGVTVHDVAVADSYQPDRACASTVVVGGLEVDRGPAVDHHIPPAVSPMTHRHYPETQRRLMT